jgi:hypothetical protein
VRLVYQPTTKHYVEILERANEGKNDRGAKLRETWEATGKAAPFVVAELTTDVTLVGGTLPPPGEGGAAGAPGAGGAGGAGGGAAASAGGGAAAAGQGGSGEPNQASPDLRVEGGGCACSFGLGAGDRRGALAAAGLVALALGASRRRRW